MKMDLIYRNKCRRWRGARPACCAGFEDQERDDNSHAEDLTEDDWLAGYGWGEKKKNIQVI